MQCPKCSGLAFHKDGKIKGKQRYRCKTCDCRFTRGTKRGYGMDKRLQALALYREGVGFRGIGRFLGVSNVTVLNWIKAFGKDVKARMLEQAPDIRDMDVVVLDELWHYTQKNGGNFGYGLLCLCAPDDSSPLRWALVVQKPLKFFGEPSRKPA